MGRNYIDSGAARGGLARSLMVKWIKKNRPDVYELAYQEAAKKFPTKNKKNRNELQLPSSLEKMK